MGMESFRKRLMAKDREQHSDPAGSSDSAAPLAIEDRRPSRPPPPPRLQPPPTPPTVDTVSNAPAPAGMSSPDSTLLSSAGWTEDGLVGCSSNFNRVRRISASVPKEDLLAAIKEHESSGLPLVIEGWHTHSGWNYDLFSINGFVGEGEQIVDARNVRTAEDVKMPLRELVQNYQSISKTAELGEKQRFYGKDIHCPTPWSAWLTSDVLPAHLHPFGEDDMFSHLPADDRPETLMCYLGTGDTFTPAHKDLCGSFGHNLMCHTEDNGSAFWFMTSTGPLHTDAPAEYFHDTLHSELDLESRTVTVDELKAAPFEVYITEQRLGDLVLVPPRSCHQVVNHGGITIKMSWSRMGLQSFQLSLYDELPLYHRVCRQEIYRVKLNVFHAVQAYGQKLSDLKSPGIESSSSVRVWTRLPISFCRDSTKDNQTEASPLLTETEKTLKSLLGLLDDILVQEWHPMHFDIKHRNSAEHYSCDFCGADIFQSFFMCQKCTGEESVEFTCCSACYLEGRSCTCEGDHMVPWQTRPFDELLAARNKAAAALDRPPELLRERVLDTSERLHLFQLACTLRKHKIDRTEPNSLKMNRRCTTRSDTDPAHDVLTTNALRCGGCHAHMCFRHILDIHGIHAADAVLAYSKDEEQEAWHTLHTSAKRKIPPPIESEGPPDLTKRMVWAASKFRTCRPLDPTRSKEGFYDEYKLVSLKGNDGEARKIDQTSGLISVVEVSADSIFGGTLSELSDDEMDIDKSSSAESSRSSSFSPTPRRRSVIKVSAKSKSRTLDPKRQAANTKSASAVRGIRPLGQIPFVLVPATPTKRPLVGDAAASPKPSKRIKTVAPQNPPDAQVSASPSSRNSNLNIIPMVTTTPPCTSRQNLTVVPIGTLVSDSPSGSQKPPTVYPSRGKSSSGPRRDRIPRDARVGPPRGRGARRRTSPSPGPSTKQTSPVTATPPTPSTAGNKAPISTARRAANTEMAKASHDDCAKKINDLKSALKESQGQEAQLRQKAQGSFLQANENRRQIERLEKEIERLKKGHEDREHHWQDFASAWPSEQEITELKSEIVRLRRTVADCEGKLSVLRSQLEDAHAQTARAEQSRGVDGLATTIATALVKGFGDGIMLNQMNSVQASQQPYQAIAGPSNAIFQVNPRMQLVTQTVAPLGPRGFDGQTRSRWASNRGHTLNHRGRDYQRFRQPFNHSRGGDYPSRARSERFDGPSRRRTPSPKRNIVYEREHDEGQSHWDDRSESRIYSEGDRDREGSVRAPSTQIVDSGHGDGGWTNIRSGARSPSYPLGNRRDRSVSRSRSSTGPSTPPRTFSPSPPFGRLDTREDQQPTSDLPRSFEAPPPSSPPVRSPVEERSADLDRASQHDGESLEETNHHQRRSASNFEHERNPWVT